MTEQITSTKKVTKRTEVEAQLFLELFLSQPTSVISASELAKLTNASPSHVGKYVRILLGEKKIELVKTVGIRERSYKLAAQFIQSSETEVKTMNNETTSTEPSLDAGAERDETFTVSEDFNQHFDRFIGEMVQLSLKKIRTQIGQEVNTVTVKELLQQFEYYKHYLESKLTGHSMQFQELKAEIFKLRHTVNSLEQNVKTPVYGPKTFSESPQEAAKKPQPEVKLPNFVVSNFPPSEVEELRQRFNGIAVILESYSLFAQDTEPDVVNKGLRFLMEQFPNVAAILVKMDTFTWQKVHLDIKNNMGNLRCPPNVENALLAIEHVIKRPNFTPAYRMTPPRFVDQKVHGCLYPPQSFNFGTPLAPTFPYTHAPAWAEGDKTPAKEREFVIVVNLNESEKAALIQEFGHLITFDFWTFNSAITPETKASFEKYANYAKVVIFKSAATHGLKINLMKLRHVEHFSQIQGMLLLKYPKSE